jgi:hypothetical protein
MEVIIEKHNVTYEVDDQAAVGVAAGGAAEEGGAVGRAGDGVEDGRVVAGVGEGVAEAEDGVVAPRAERPSREEGISAHVHPRFTTRRRRVETAHRSLLILTNGRGSGHARRDRDSGGGRSPLATLCFWYERKLLKA